MKPLWPGLAALAVATGAGEPAVGPGPDAAWFLITARDGQVMGHASQESRPVAGGSEIAAEQDIFLTEQDSPAAHIRARSVRRLDTSGNTLWIESTTGVGGSVTRTVARNRTGWVEVVRQTPVERRVSILPLSSSVRFDDGEPLLAAWDPLGAAPLAFERFDADSASVERVVIEAPPGASFDADGHIAVLRRRYEGDQLLGVSRLTLDRERRVIRTEQPMFGSVISIRPADRKAALAYHAPYRLIASTMTRSPFRISNPATRGHIRYRFAFRDDLAFDLPQTGEQRVGSADGKRFVDICGDCGPGLATDKAALADALKPTAWMQSDHPRLKALAAPIARLRVSDTRKMQMLIEVARPYLGRIDFNGHFSALETLERRAGDCTEAAVLLGALGRAAGIPTKVANGVVYSREAYHGVGNAFLPHSWTLAYVDGRWKSFDLALDSFDSTHIALTVGDGDARSVSAAGQLASLLVWQDMAEVRTRVS